MRRMAGLAIVSTHSRPKAAVAGVAIPVCFGISFQHTAARRRLFLVNFFNCRPLSFNTQPPEGGWSIMVMELLLVRVSTHSRPKAAVSSRCLMFVWPLFQHTAARRRLMSDRKPKYRMKKFQHTAARRRLLRCKNSSRRFAMVSTHSRPKAADHHGFINTVKN